ncbi:MAG: SDR family oxidoreductase [Candidatus Sulfotelmatobacter sp.]
MTAQPNAQDAKTAVAAKFQNILITGASGGIGYELAKLFARDRANLILVSRSVHKLAEVARELQSRFGCTVKTIALDLGTPAAAKFLFDQVQGEGIAIDILVNNAGFGAFGEFAQMAEQEIQGQIALNITALTQLTRLFLPPMMTRRRGRIMNVASTAAFQPGPLMAVYYASKAYVLSFSEALANEVNGSGVTVTCLCPGPTNTNFAKRAGNDNSRLFKKIGGMSAETVARDGYRGLVAGKIVVISGVQNWLAAESVRFAPRKMVTAISRWVSEKAE